MEIKQIKIKNQMEVFNIVFLFVCILIIVVKYWLHIHKKEENIHPLNAEVRDEGARNISSDKKEELQYTSDTINMWTNNCDQKASILLAIIGVIITILVSSDFMKYLRICIFAPFLDYWTGNSEFVFSWSRFNVLFLLLISAIMLIMSCHYLFKTISANIDYQKMRKENPKLVNKSNIFFGEISKMTYEDFKKDEINYLEDLKSQIYVNSKIASNKFRYFNKSLDWFKFLLWVSIMLFIAIMMMR